MLGRRQSKVGVKAKGPNIPLASVLPIADPVQVRAQVRNGVGECWEASFSAPRRNDSDRFSAKSD